MHTAKCDMTVKLNSQQRLEPSYLTARRTSMAGDEK